MPRHIAIAVPEYEPLVGGTTRQVALLARELRRRGHDVTVLTRRRESSLPREDVVDGVRIVRVGRPGRGKLAEKSAALAVLAWLRRRRGAIALLHTVMWTDVAAIAGASGFGGRTIVGWGARGDATDELVPRGGMVRRRYAAVRRRRLSNSAHVALTPQMEAELRSLGIRLTAVIPIGVDRAVFRPPAPDERERARVALGIAAGEFAIGYVGHLRALKALDRLVDALALLRGDEIRSRLVLAGGARGARDDVEAALRAQVARLSLDSSVVFTGVLADPRPVYWACDAFVLPSTREGMPNSLLESMACGVPCVAAASAEGAELLDARSGIVTASNDPGVLARVLKVLALDPGRRAALGEEARKRAEAFGVDRMVDAYESLYRGVMD